MREQVAETNRYRQGANLPVVAGLLPALLGDLNTTILGSGQAKLHSIGCHRRAISYELAGGFAAFAVERSRLLYA
ncbi:hypothetical protein [Streptomyces hydrogenans]|uniref:hypothetical protein n=1 Tax=Streptomyces hydrogenans TaxID=1873719 RepID=UPI00167C864B|nr:hypothetical protein [Streptomyces hydrogenans]GHG41738.1 hypothetical protein GCM10018784_64470 [Streptomyces hydrogenans]